jgi:hypothetical protein
MQPTSQSSRAFFSQLIDYAGLFPPAALKFSNALENYQQYISSPKSWMVGRFIVGSSHLDDIEKSLTSVAPGTDIELVLVTKNLDNDLQKIAKLVGESAKKVHLGCVEMQLDSKAGLRRQIEDAVKSIPNVIYFFEVPYGPNWEGLFDEAVSITQQLPSGSPRAGLKVRCGGLEPQQVPAPARVAHALYACAQARVPIKFTAGIHKPFRCEAPKEGSCTAHGYFNILFAALSAFSAKAGKDQLKAIIVESKETHPAFTDDGINWLGIEISTEQIEHLRKNFVIGFGSCSVDEPLEEAERLEWLR